MKKFLAAGGAAFALLIGAGSAMADGFQVKVGGDALFEGGYVQQNRDDGLRNTEFRNRFRLTVNPNAKADNGLEYGARLRLNVGQNSGATDADLAYMYAKGGFGQLSVGSVDSYNHDHFVGAPLAYRGLSDVSDATILPWIGPMGISTTGTLAGSDVGSTQTGFSSLDGRALTFDDNATKIRYDSPVYAGFQVGMSFTPRTDSKNLDVNRTKSVGAGAYQNVYENVGEIGVNYSATLGGAKVAAGAGYMFGEAANNGSGSIGKYNDLSAWQIGGSVGFQGFTLGASYTDFGKSGQTKAGFLTAGGAPVGAATGIPVYGSNDGYVWNVGGQYQIGNVAVGAGYLRGKDAGSLAVAGERTVDDYNLGASYNVAPGLVVAGEYHYFTAKSDLRNLGAVANDKGSVFLVRTGLAF